jgi:CheY-like chemotaxis protein
VNEPHQEAGIPAYSMYVIEPVSHNTRHYFIMTVSISRRMVLVADDEPSVLSLVERIVTRIGFIPLPVKNGAAAIQAVEEHHECLHCVILDIMMPIMNGVDAAFAIQQIAPEVPVILMSGMCDHAEEIKDLHLAGMITKPFSVDYFSSSILCAADGRVIENSYGQ